MSNNIFSGRRLLLLCRQHLIHNTQLLMFSTVAYVGAIFIVLSVVQVSDDFKPHAHDNFQGFMVAFVALFGIVYAGHAFPAFRSKESTISYLMVPASVPEKFVFEFLNRFAVIILMPLLYWATFHLQGYFFSIFTDEAFQPIGAEYLVEIDSPEDYQFIIYTIIIAGSLLAVVLAFTGATMFGKQPLVKTLFAVALIIMLFFGYSYIVIEHLGLENYAPPENMYLLPVWDEAQALRLVSLALIAAVMVMLFVAFRKLKEREV